jgi:hypothetical protein
MPEGGREGGVQELPGNKLNKIQTGHLVLLLNSSAAAERATSKECKKRQTFNLCVFLL